MEGGGVVAAFRFLWMGGEGGGDSGERWDWRLVGGLGGRGGGDAFAKTGVLKALCEVDESGLERGIAAAI